MDPSYVLERLHSLRRPVQEALVGLPSLEASLTEEQRSLVQALAQECSLLATRLSQLLVSPEGARAAPLIIAVDDDEHTLLALRELLEPEFEVKITCDPHVALEMIRDRRPDAVLSDIRMPEMSGYSLVEALRGDDTTADIPCVFVSACRETREQVKAFDVGGFDFVNKPVNIDELAARLRNAVKRGRELRAHRSQKERDELTGLPNRRALKTFLASASSRARAFFEPLAVVMIDQDRLKLVNDGFGHGAGDASIRAVANALLARKRKTDLVARIGGDEYALVMPGARRADAERILVQVLAELARTPFLDGEPTLRASFSFGVAQLGETGDDSPEQLLARADAELFTRKRARPSPGAPLAPPPGEASCAAAAPAE